MKTAKALLLGSALLALSACVTDDGYGGGYGGYSDGHYASSGYGYATPVYSSAPVYAAPQPYSRATPVVDCNLPGRDVNTTPWECRDLQRRYGTSEYDSRRQVRCNLPGEDTVTSPDECRRLQRRAGGRSEHEASRNQVRCNLPGSDTVTTPENCRQLQRRAGGRSEAEAAGRSNRNYGSGDGYRSRRQTPVSE